ncbi:flagellar biosynthesis protein FliQ [Candidatus Haliotispira prima]|uniref:Flagellar biosynthetic protein FliQ n=1 Tax=Candidatus Haliotispira prima TaxID=3034016 RepID=A0ABY8MIG0_9SPIO|nr:flagellar biosynthesis protein FliQ [Candidatus Haliotispira prima]
MDNVSGALITQILQGGVLQVLLVASPILLIAVLVGLLISIFQATTSIQDQTLTFVPKILAVLLIFAVLGGWMLNTLANYTIQLIEMVPQVANLG